jgi:MHS family proline/betaine transporter-like MFS transporter
LVKVVSQDGVTAGSTRGAVVAGAIGNVIEWYDFGIYAYLATVISSEIFAAGAAGLLLTFATFGVGFVMRPVGSIVLGHFGDKYGRRQALMFTVLVMAVSTCLIGLVPTYSAIGIWAPIILLILRLAQGFSAGGEWGGSAAFLVEYASQQRRGFVGSWQQFSIVLSLLLGSIVGAATTALPHDTLYSWGWRIPFLVGIIAAPVGVYLRYGMPDTPKFRRLSAEEGVENAPLIKVFRTHWRQILQAFGFTIVWTVAYYLFLTYFPTYLETQLDISYTRALLATSGELALTALLIPFMGTLSDRIGRKPLLIASCVLFIVLPYPLFIAAGASYTAVILIALAFGVSIAVFSGPGPAAIAELFPTNVRYSALSIPYNIATAVFGGFAPFIATALIGATGQRLSPTYYIIAAAIVSLATIWTFRESARRGLQ